MTPPDDLFPGMEFLITEDLPEGTWLRQASARTWEIRPETYELVKRLWGSRKDISRFLAGLGQAVQEVGQALGQLVQALHALAEKDKPED